MRRRLLGVRQLAAESSAPIVSHDSVEATSVPGASGAERQPEVAGRPELAAAFVAAVLLERVRDRAGTSSGSTVNAFSCAVEKEPQRRQVAAGSDLEPVADRVHAGRARSPDG